jgi:hypothetical protein
MAGVTRNWRRPAPQDEHEIDPRDLYYLDDGVYRAVKRTAIVTNVPVQDGKRTILREKRIATAVQVVKIGSRVQDSGWRPGGRPVKPPRKERP